MNTPYQSVGIDIVDIARFEKIINRWGDRFLQRILTANERAYCQKKATKIQSMAVRFAAKEAFIKCLSEDLITSFGWQDMEVKNKKNGKPFVVLHGHVAKALDENNILISLSHTATSAVAIIILQK